jgi:hypothetical protein
MELLQQLNASKSSVISHMSVELVSNIPDCFCLCQSVLDIVLPTTETKQASICKETAGNGYVSL